jgi:hypothetical protein
VHGQRETSCSVHQTGTKRRTPRKERRRLLLANTYRPQSQPKRPTRPLHYLLARKSPKPGALLQPSQPLRKTKPAPSAEPTSSPRFILTKKLYHTFSTLFHQPSTTSQPGEVPWTDFISAMSTIIFLPEKLYGSVWRFTPKDGSTFGTETPINFHEPHPSTKLPFRTAMMYGRRLTRHYGLDGDCFVLGG